MNISVIIPAYKAQKYIEKCLDSIVAQTYFKNNDYEIILGIDGCEETLKKVKNIRHKYPRLRVLWCKENKGCYVMTNTLIQQVKYDYIQKFDSDDWMMENMIREMVKALGKKSAVYSQCYKWNGDISGVQDHHNSILIRRKVYDKLGGYQAWKCAADGEFESRIQRHFEVVKLKKPLFYYRRHKDSLTKEYGKNSSKRKGYHKIKKQLNTDNTTYVKPITNKFDEL